MYAPPTHISKAPANSKYTFVPSVPMVQNTDLPLLSSAPGLFLHTAALKQSLLLEVKQPQLTTSMGMGETLQHPKGFLPKLGPIRADS